MTQLTLAPHVSPLGTHPAAPAPPADLAEAWQVQQHLFPRQLPRLVGWDVAAACRPARVVAGDYYDLFPVGPGRLAVVLGDVSGKGLGPALVMAGLRALLRARLVPDCPDLPDLMAELNRYLVATTPPETFVTLFLGVLESESGRLRYVNAGHQAPLVLAGPHAEPMRITTGGPLLGVLGDVTFEAGSAGLRPGSLLALFSDGLPDAADSAGRMFHQRRVVEALRAGRGGSAAGMMRRLLEAVERFRGSHEQIDDVSVILLKRGTPEG